MTGETITEIEAVIATGETVTIRVGDDLTLQRPGRGRKLGRVTRVGGSGAEARVQVRHYYRARPGWSAGTTWYDASDVIARGWDQALGYHMTG